MIILTYRPLGQPLELRCSQPGENRVQTLISGAPILESGGMSTAGQDDQDALGGDLGNPEPGLLRPYDIVPPEQRMLEWLTKASFASVLLFGIADALAMGLSASTDLQVALTGILGFFMGLLSSTSPSGSLPPDSGDRAARIALSAC